MSRSSEPSRPSARRSSRTSASIASAREILAGEHLKPARLPGAVCLPASVCLGDCLPAIVRDALGSFEDPLRNDAAGRATLAARIQERLPAGLEVTCHAGLLGTTVIVTVSDGGSGYSVEVTP